uniref:Uncharacterized protein n=1 Tax=Vespula pensylvanica TaxID=30213 RepID=A0A834PD17_VESPE|nr:hypothetical protein H0235_004041 [Vespula pensylvanica]
MRKEEEEEEEEDKKAKNEVLKSDAIEKLIESPKQSVSPIPRPLTILAEILERPKENELLSFTASKVDHLCIYERKREREEGKRVYLGMGLKLGPFIRMDRFHFPTRHYWPPPSPPPYHCQPPPVLAN